jgi:hypothetical protein
VSKIGLGAETVTDVNEKRMGNWARKWHDRLSFKIYFPGMVFSYYQYNYCVSYSFPDYGVRSVN